MEIDLPHNWTPRRYQLAAWQEMEAGCRRNVIVWHRRAGKDAFAIHWTTVAAFQRVGTYWHMLPSLAQGRKVIWDGTTNDGERVMSAWPDKLVRKRRNDEMKLDLVNGSIWQVVGSDNYDSLVGSNPIGVVFSEYSIADWAAWNFISPILAANDGWAMFIFTPRGRNHGWDLYNMARRTDGWHASLLTVDDTGAISPEAIQAERDRGMSEEMIQQEYFCSFEAPLQGAYYAAEMMLAEKDHRICSVPYDKAVPVETWWDLGIGDSTAIWFSQRVGKEIHLIDYYENAGESLDHYVGVINARGYNVEADVVPHDAEARELISGKTRIEALKSMNRRPVVVKRHTVDDRINAVRMNFNKCWFDARKCSKGIESLRSYRKEQAPMRQWKDEQTPTFKDRPVHDWASHGADAFGYGIMYTPANLKNWDTALEYDNRGIV